jgi:hypothetical protein
MGRVSKAVCSVLIIFLVTVLSSFAYSPGQIQPLKRLRLNPLVVDRFNCAKVDEPAIKSTASTCRFCKKQYDCSDNLLGKAGPCVFHPGIYSGRLNRVNDIDTSDKEFFWSCCGEYELGAVGCINAERHYSYDEQGPRYSVLTGKRIA